MSLSAFLSLSSNEHIALTITLLLPWIFLSLRFPSHFLSPSGIHTYEELLAINSSCTHSFLALGDTYFNILCSYFPLDLAHANCVQAVAAASLLKQSQQLQCSSSHSSFTVQTVTLASLFKQSQQLHCSNSHSSFTVLAVTAASLFKQSLQLHFSSNDSSFSVQAVTAAPLFKQSQQLHCSNRHSSFTVHAVTAASLLRQSHQLHC